MYIYIYCIMREYLTKKRISTFNSEAYLRDSISLLLNALGIEDYGTPCMHRMLSGQQRQQTSHTQNALSPTEIVNLAYTECSQANRDSICPRMYRMPSCQQRQYTLHGQNALRLQSFFHLMKERFLI